MIEIPEAVVLSGQLEAALAGKKIEHIIAGSSPHKFTWYYGDPDCYSDLAVGATIHSARAVGGMVEGAADDVRLLFSEGANLRVLTSDDAPPKKHQLLVTFSDGTLLTASVRMYGGIGVFPAGALDNEIYLVACERPSPLTDAFDEDYFRALLSSPEIDKLSAKALLATEQRIPGLGNGVLQDILFRAGVNPRRKLRDFEENQLDRLFAAVKAVLREMTDTGGRDTELDLHGSSGGYVTLMSRNTLGTPCPACGHPIEKKAYMGGSVYYCPVCQPEH